MKKVVGHGLWVISQWSLVIRNWSWVVGRGSWVNGYRSLVIRNYLLAVCCFLLISPARAQSVGYYPWNGLFSVSTNPTKPIWLDARLQTNTLFGSLSTEILPMANLKQTQMMQYYVGGGVRFNFIGAIAGVTKNVVEGYCLNVGARIAPLNVNRNLKIVFEFSPYATRKFDSGVFRSNFGLVYVLK